MSTAVLSRPKGIALPRLAGYGAVAGLAGGIGMAIWQMGQSAATRTGGPGPGRGAADGHRRAARRGPRAVRAWPAQARQPHRTRLGRRRTSPQVPGARRPGRAHRHVGRGDHWAAQIITDRANTSLNPHMVRDGKPPPDAPGRDPVAVARPLILLAAVEASGPGTEVFTFTGPKPAAWWTSRRVHEVTVLRAGAAIALGAPTISLPYWPWTASPECAGFQGGLHHRHPGRQGNRAVRLRFQAVRVRAVVFTAEPLQKLATVVEETEARCPVLNLLPDAKVDLRTEWLRDTDGTREAVPRPPATT